NFVLRRHPNWRIEGEPWLAGIDYKLIQDLAAATAAFSADEIDSVSLNNRLESDALLDRHGDDINLEENVTASVWTLQGRADGAWANPLVRQAVSMGMDRQVFIDLMALGDGVISGPVPPPFTAQALGEAEIRDTWGKFDPVAANAALDAAAFDRSVQYEMKYPLIGELYSQFPQVAAQQLSDNLGLKISVVPEDFGTWLQQSLYGSNYNGFMAYPSLAYDDPSSYIGAYAKEIGGRPNWAAFQDDEMDAAYINQKTLLDDEERFLALLDIQRLAWDKGAPFWPTFVRVTKVAWWNRVQGRVTGRGSFGAYNGRVYIDENA
ncbi:MAG: ABC transporter substrate-binding protein, partial [Dehalococcoidia bacterium]